MAKTEVILTSNVVGLGAESDQVKVSAGYARNFLLPNRLAIAVSDVNKRRLEVLRQRRAEREAHELNTMTELAKSLEKLICIIKVKTGDDGKMHGTVTNGMIADEMKTQFDVSLDKRKIHLDHSIRALGDFEAELNLHPDVKGKLKIRVESINPPPAPTEVAADAKREDGRGGKYRKGDHYGKSEAGDKKPAKAAKAE